MKNIGVFLDRDGTICKEVGYLEHPDKLEILPQVTKSIILLNKNNIKVIVATNQSGVARGYFSKDTLESINRRMVEILKKSGANIDAVYYCPHHPEDGCNCRKPKPGMLFQAETELSIDLSSSFVIGDRINDIVWGKSVGTKGILVLTGLGKDELKKVKTEDNRLEYKPDYISKNLHQAVKWIVKMVKEGKVKNERDEKG